jgi:hypothetical protein
MAFFHVDFKVRGYFLEPLLWRELAANRKILAAKGAAPGNGASVDFIYYD